MLSDATRDVALRRYAGGSGELGRDEVACEEPLEIRLGGVPLAVVMRTPGDDRELTLGFLSTERVIERPEQVESVRHCGASPEEAEDNVVQVVLAPGVSVDLDRPAPAKVSKVAGSLPVSPIIHLHKGS